MLFGILRRYVFGQVLRAFLLALIAITAIFVLFMVMAEATRKGLSPQDILRIVPFIIPGTLPFTIPVAMLFSVSVVYGRMAGDNEVVAVKTAGLSATILLWPTWIFGMAVGAALAYLSTDAIPRCNRAVTEIIFHNFEDLFYKLLKKDREVNNPKWPFFVRVNDVEGKTMIGATFKHRVPDKPDEYDLTVQAKRAQIDFDTEALQANVTLEDAEVDGSAAGEFIVIINDKQVLQYPIPDSTDLSKMQKKIQEKTNRELSREEADVIDKIKRERKRQAILAAFQIASGRLAKVDPLMPGLHVQVEGINWRGIREAFHQYKYWELKKNELETERQFRAAISFGVFFFVLLGAPVGILFARRDFLSAFITCFIPIIILYYPLLLAGVNLGKEGVMWPAGVWAGNLLLGLLAVVFALPPVKNR